MTTLADYRDERLRKLGEIKDAGINPYPSKSSRDTIIFSITDNFDKMKGKEVTIAGRITAIRKFGKIAFVKIRDYSGEIQIFMQKQTDTTVGEGSFAPTGANDRELPRNDGRSDRCPSDGSIRLLSIKDLRLLDTGDFIEATGTVDKTSTGEISVFANQLRLLTKALRPLPGRDGFTNKEERYRRRYVDMNVNLEVRERMVRRSKFWQATRQFMLDHGFVEINVPVLEHTTGGADANPFVTHMDALDEDLYLRISHELPLKRLIGAGFEKVFDIGPRFRNEGVDDEHLPEHIAFEAYAAYENYEDGMKFYEEMMKYVARETWGTLKFHVGAEIDKKTGEEIPGTGFDIDLDNGGKPWPRIKYADLLKEKYDVDVFNPDREQLKRILLNDFNSSADKNDKAARKNLEHTLEVASDARLIDSVWKLIRKTSGGPYWVIEEPTTLSPLAKTSSENPLVTERFHPIIAGTEMGNGFSELNDPLDQLERFKEQQAARDAGDLEAQMLDQDFVEMLEYGMPPTCGWGNSERNFWLLEGVPGREGVPFPLMKRQ